LEELVVGKSIKIENVYYDQGKWDIRADAKVELDKMVALMNENPTMEVELSSHTDSRGSDASNLSLSDKRAKAVVAYIVSKGIAASRMTGKGYGESKLLNNCGNGVKCSEAEHQKNRRTEFKILKIS
jgi:outer membrane protein OmpA-like peptidoglycan-associated protein